MGRHFLLPETDSAPTMWKVILRLLISDTNTKFKMGRQFLLLALPETDSAPTIVENHSEVVN
jgi:hypothetical protein